MRTSDLDILFFVRRSPLPLALAWILAAPAQAGLSVSGAPGRAQGVSPTPARLSPAAALDIPSAIPPGLAQPSPGVDIPAPHIGEAHRSEPGAAVPAILAGEPLPADSPAIESEPPPLPVAAAPDETTPIEKLSQAAQAVSEPAADPAERLAQLFDFRAPTSPGETPIALWMEAVSADPDSIAWARGLISRAAARYADDDSRISPLHGWEAPYLGPSGMPGGHVVSLGSGPDAFRPARDFPTAAHFHLVDLLRGWGRGPGHVVYEFIRRVQALAAGGSVRLVDAGFAARVPGRLIAAAALGGPRHDLPPEFWKGWERDPAFRRPLVLEALSGHPRGPPASRRFSLHPLSYDDPSLVRELLADIPPGEALVGLLLTGAPAPHRAHLLPLLERLAAGGGAFVLETFPFPEFRTVLNLLRERGMALTRTPREPKEHPRFNQATVFIARQD